MASTYLKDLRSRQDGLLERLITHVLPVKKEEENFAVAWDFCAGNINPKYHSFKKLHAKDVGRICHDLEARMEQHSQVSKALRLRQLRNQLASLGMEGVEPDTDAAVIHLLLQLANKPLQSVLPAASLQTWRPEEQPAMHAQPEPSVRGSDDEDEEASWSSSSELSDWDKEEDDIDVEDEEEAQQGGVSHSQPDNAAAEVAWERLLQSSQAWIQQAVQRPDISNSTRAAIMGRPLIPALSQSSKSDLLPALSQARLKDTAAFARPRPDRCLSDSYIVHQVLNALLDQPSTCFTWQADNASTNSSGCSSAHSTAAVTQRLVPVAGIHVPYLSPDLLRSLLLEFAEAGTQVRWLQGLVAASTRQEAALGARGAAGELHLTPCTRAMLQAVGAQLQVLMQPLAHLQQGNQDVATTGKLGTMSLLQLRQLCLSPMARMRSLFDIVQGALKAQADVEVAVAAPETAQPVKDSAEALSSTALLDYLHGQLRIANLWSGVQGAVHSQMLLHLFLCSMSPMLNSVHAWLFNSREDALATDFFILPGQHVPEHDPNYWSQAYKLALRSTKPADPAAAAASATGVSVDQIACPIFLQSVANEIFSAGKSLRLLKNREWASLTPGGASVLAAAPIRILVAHAGQGVVQAVTGANARDGSSHIKSSSLTPCLQQVFLTNMRAFLDHLQQKKHDVTPHGGNAQPGSAASHSEPGARSTGLQSFYDLMSAAGQGTAPVHKLQPQGVPAWAPPLDTWGLGHDAAEQQDMHKPAAGTQTPRTPLDVEAALAGGSSPVRPVGASAALARPGSSTQAPVQDSDASTRPRDGVSPPAPDEPAAPLALTDWASCLEDAFKVPQAPATLMGCSGNQGNMLASSTLGSSWNYPATGSEAWLSKDQSQSKLKWLLDGPDVQLPEIDLLIELCLLEPARQQAAEIEQRLLSDLLSDWGLVSELSALRNLFLLASPAAQSWATQLLSGILKGRPLHEHQEYELEMALQDAYASSSTLDEVLPASESLSVVVDHASITQIQLKHVESGEQRFPGIKSVRELGGLTMRYQPTWVLSMIGGNEAIKSYNHALVFLLQIQLARMALGQARMRHWKAWQNCEKQKYGAAEPAPAPAPRRQGARQAPATTPLSEKQEELVMQEMTHFVNSTHQFVSERLVYGAWGQLVQDVDRAQSLDEVVLHHKTFLQALDRQAGKCAQTPPSAWAVTVITIIRILDQVIKFCGAQYSLCTHRDPVLAAKVMSAQVHKTNVGQGQGTVAMATRHMQEAASAFKTQHGVLLKFVRGNAARTSGAENDMEAYANLLNLNNYYE